MAEDISSAKKNNQSLTVVAIELLTFHHEVLLAFCNQAIEAGLNIKIIAPMNGIGKALKRHESKSLQCLEQLSKNKNCSANVHYTNDDYQTKLLADTGDAIFLSTVPSPPKRAIHLNHNRTFHSGKQSRIEMMAQMVHSHSSKNHPIYIVINNPINDLKVLQQYFTKDELKNITLIALSHETSSKIEELCPDTFMQTIVMPAIGIKHQSIQSNKNHLHYLPIVGEVSSSRRQYESLILLNPYISWLKKRKTCVILAGRIKCESWQEKALSFLKLAPGIIVLLRYPKLFKQWLHKTLDLSLVSYKKLSDIAINQLLEDSSCILDLQSSRYASEGRTSGTLGLAMTYEKPLLTLEDFVNIINQCHDQSSNQLEALISIKLEQLRSLKTAMKSQFQQDLAQSIYKQSDRRDK